LLVLTPNAIAGLKTDLEPHKGSASAMIALASVSSSGDHSPYMSPKMNQYLRIDSSMKTLSSAAFLEAEHA
jgi:hypothetical protein